MKKKFKKIEEINTFPLLIVFAFLFGILLLLLVLIATGNLKVADVNDTNETEFIGDTESEESNVPAIIMERLENTEEPTERGESDTIEINEVVDKIADSIENFDEEKFNENRFEHLWDFTAYWDATRKAVVLQEDYVMPTAIAALWPWDTETQTTYAVMVETLFDYLNVPSDTYVEEAAPTPPVAIFTDESYLLNVKVNSAIYILGMDEDVVYIRKHENV